MRTSKPLAKEGLLYSEIRDTLRPFDLLLFSGGEYISRFIKYLETVKLERIRDTPVEPGAFSHVGIVVTSEILDHPKVLPGKVYIWESVLGGKFGYGIKNVNDTTFFGVQLRDLDNLLPAYDLSNDTRVAVAHLIDNPLDDGIKKGLIKERFSKTFQKYNGVFYDFNLIDEFGALFKGCRKVRDGIESILGNKSWLFCSEHVAQIYVDMGIMPKSVICENVVPMNFVGYESDPINKGGIPIVVKLPPTYIISDVHLKKDGI